MVIKKGIEMQLFSTATYTTVYHLSSTPLSLSRLQLPTKLLILHFKELQELFQISLSQNFVVINYNISHNIEQITFPEKNTQVKISFDAVIQLKAQ